MNLKPIQAACLLQFLCTGTIYGQPVKKSDDNRIIIDAASTGAKIPSSVYGIFFEEIRHSSDRGLYGEFIQSRRNTQINSIY